MKITNQSIIAHFFKDDELSQHCLECHGEIQTSSNINDLSEGSLLKAGEIRILFSNSTYHAKIINKCSIQLFGHNLDPSLAMLEKQNLLFQMARYSTIFELFIYIVAGLQFLYNKYYILSFLC
jgi:hypothetical protein